MAKTLTVFSRHPSHDILRGKLKFPVRTCVRFGSLNPGKLKYSIQINTIEAVEASSNKRLMKEAFDRAGIHTAKWYTDLNALMQAPEAEVHYPIIGKNIFGSRGKGNHLFKNRQEIEQWIVNRNVHNYIFEQFYDYNREYRIHVTKEGCFYTCRKLLREETPKDKRWFRNDSNCLWIVEDNPKFNKPSNWDTIVNECVLGLKEIGLDIGAFDVRVQSEKDKKGRIRENPEYIIIESNSAPSFGDITAQKYLEVIPKVWLVKANENLERNLKELQNT